MKIGEHAERGGGPPVVLASELPGRQGTILANQLKSSDEVTDEGEFPEHGVFLEIETPDEQVELWECPGALSSELVEVAGEGENDFVGRSLRVERAWKDADGSWRFEIELGDP